MKIIELISLKDPQHNKHCMRILDTFIYRKHYCIVFNIMSMNLRELLNKYGRNIGLHLDAVKVYGYQLFTALKHIHSINIIHADLKPDNILVNEEKNSIQLADFGSAIFTDGANEVTPYLVSRYYRAPEVILGLKYCIFIIIILLSLLFSFPFFALICHAFHSLFCSHFSLFFLFLSLSFFCFLLVFFLIFFHSFFTIIIYYYSLSN